MRDMAYIARCHCGGIIMACVDDPTHKQDTAKEVASCLRAGFTIDRIKCNDVKTSKWCENRGKCTKQSQQ